MTNRKWLSTLSDEEFVDWLLSEEHLDMEHMRAIQPSPKLDTIRKMNISSYDGLINWLKEER